jgi:hypothetical protein
VKRRLSLGCPIRILTRSLQGRRIFRMESAALPHGDGFDSRQGIATDSPLLPQPWFRPLARNAPQAPAVYCHTVPALPANPHSHQVSRRPGVSRFLKQARPDLFPGDDIERVSRMSSDAVIKLRPLRIRQAGRVRFQLSQTVSRSSAFSAAEGLSI